MDMGQNKGESIDVEYPSTLRIEVASTDELFRDAIATAEEFEDASAQRNATGEAILTYDCIGQLREVLTAERLELLESLLAASAESGSQLARRLDRATADVLDDIDVLETAGLIVCQEGDVASHLSVPYDRIVIEYTIQPDGPAVDSDPAA